MKYGLMLLPVLLALSGCSQSDPADSMLVCQKRNFAIKYPGTWRVDTSGTMGTEWVIFSPLENENDKFSENVNVLIQPLAGLNIDMNKYRDISERQLASAVTDGKIYESTIGKTENGERYKIVYSMLQGTFRLKILSYCYIKNEKAYLVTFTAELDKYDRYRKTGEAVLHSFLPSE